MDLIQIRIKELLEKKSDSDTLKELDLKKSQRDNAMEIAYALLDKAKRGDVNAAKELYAQYHRMDMDCDREITITIHDV